MWEKGGHSTQVTPAGIPRWRQGSKLTGPFSSGTTVEGGGGARGWVLAWLGVSLGFGGSSTRKDLRDLQKSLPSRVLSFLIHQMSGQLIFKTLSSGNITSQFSSLHRPYSPQTCSLSPQPEPDDWKNTQKGDVPKDKDLDSAQIHLDLRLGPQLNLPPPNLLHSQGGWGESVDGLGCVHPWVPCRSTDGHINPPSPGIESILAKPFSISTTTQPPTRQDTERMMEKCEAWVLIPDQPRPPSQTVPAARTPQGLSQWLLIILGNWYLIFIFLARLEVP